MNFHNPRVISQAAAAISSTSSGKGALNNVIHLIIMNACLATVPICGFLNLLIPLDFCAHVLFLSSPGFESVSAAAHFWWEFRGREWKVTVIKALSLKFSLCWELTGPDDGVDRGLSTDVDHVKEADKPVVGAFNSVGFGGF